MIDYGDRARLGVLLPSGNSVAEAELHAMLPAGVGLNLTRLRLTGSSEADLMGMLDALEDAARLLADAKVDRIAFHCTAVSTFAPHLSAKIQQRIETASGTKAFSTADAILAALARFNARTVVLVTPYIESVHAREIVFLETHGFDVISGGWLGVNTNEAMALIDPKIISDLARVCCNGRKADALLLSCTAIRSAGLIAPLEAELGIPVITSNQAMLWHALTLLGIPDGMPGFGLLAQPETATTLSTPAP